jgi:hypothetical protein
MSGRLFSVEEANALLPTLIPLVERVLAARERIVGAGAELERVLEQAGGNGGSQRASEAAGEVVAIQEALEAINGLGCELKDINTGLVDFPAEHPAGEGRVVYLCWQYGEAQVAWWHELDAGFAGRQRL